MQFRNAAKINDSLWPLGAVLEPIVAILAAGDFPAGLTVFFKQLQRVFDMCWLKQRKLRHHIFSHVCASLLIAYFKRFIRLGLTRQRVDNHIWYDRSAIEVHATESIGNRAE